MPWESIARSTRQEVKLRKQKIPLFLSLLIPRPNLAKCNPPGGCPSSHPLLISVFSPLFSVFAVKYTSWCMAKLNLLLNVTLLLADLKMLDFCHFEPFLPTLPSSCTDLAHPISFQRLDPILPHPIPSPNFTHWRQGHMGEMWNTYTFKTETNVLILFIKTTILSISTHFCTGHGWPLAPSVTRVCHQGTGLAPQQIWGKSDRRNDQKLFIFASELGKILHFSSPPYQRSKIRYLPPKDQQRQWQNGFWTCL